MRKWQEWLIFWPIGAERLEAMGARRAYVVGVVAGVIAALLGAILGFLVA